MVVDYVEDHLDAGCVQSAHRHPHFVARAVRQIARLDGKKSDRIVAPVILQAALDQRAVLHEGVDRQQLDRGDAEIAASNG